jgi:uncharacterized repeat protein (TIGR04138 family)
MEAPTIIPCDLSCAKCEYNLRGLNPSGRCPECGAPISPSILRKRRFSGQQEASFSIAWRDHLRERAAQACGLPLEAIDLIPLALRRAQKVGMVRDISAGYLAVAAFHVILEHFGRETPQKLERLGLHTAQDVGRVVFAMADVGLVQPSEGDSLSDFEGLPTMADLWAMASKPEHDWYALTQAPPRDQDADPEGAVV